MIQQFPILVHHGALHGVTGSCHELRLSPEDGLLVDCGLFQGDDAPEGQVGRRGNVQRRIDFPVEHIKALVVTHVHLDHVGRIPYLLAAGFKGPIYCSEPSAVLLPLMLEDAVKIGFTDDQRLIEAFLDHLKTLLSPLPYGQWQPIACDNAPGVAIRLQPAGHILGSAYMEISCTTSGKGGTPAPASCGWFFPATSAPPIPRCCRHPSHLGRPTPWYWKAPTATATTNARNAPQALQAVIEKALADNGTVLIPAFSIGRTQELLYELEDIIQLTHRFQYRRHDPWPDLPIVLDSPLASRFTETYQDLQPFWDKEALKRVGRPQPAQVRPADRQTATRTLNMRRHLAQSGRPAIVIAASGMCSGGRIVNYLKAMLGDKRTQCAVRRLPGQGHAGPDIQQYGPSGGYVDLDGERYRSAPASIASVAIRPTPTRKAC